MDSATKDLYYQKIKELLQDEEKVITCSSLAATLEISIKDAKTLLTDFVQDYHELKGKEIYITFILSGNLKNCDGLAVHLVKEEDLNEKIALFDTVFTKFIYSIQKNKDTNLNSVLMTDKDKMESSSKLLGTVIGKNCIKRIVKKCEILEPKHDKLMVQKISSNNGTMELQNQSQTRQSSQEKTKIKSGKGIANFFTKALSNPTAIKSENRKTNSLPTLKTENEIKINSEPAEKENSEKMDIDNSVDLSSNSLNVQNNTGNKKRKKTVKADNGTNKRRKRIQEICDSDSDDIFEDEEEDIIEKSDNELEFVSKIEVSVPTKKKIRKAIDETHMDEEGFLVTTTKYIYESGSEDEKDQTTTEPPPKVLSQKKNNTTADVDNDPKKQQRKGKNNKKVANGKQTTLMNFFKRN